MNWRKWNRWIHRELGFLFFGMTIIYGISGIALNHHAARHWDPGIITHSTTIQYPDTLRKADVDRNTIEKILEITKEKENYKQYYYPSQDHLMIYLKGGHIAVNLQSGSMQVIKIRNRPVFSELNYLHYNKPKKLWTWFSDLYAFGLILIAISGLFLIKGRTGITGRGGILTIIGILIPLILLIIYLWL
ncbi:MAG: PepSY-associated TM helix domain-containing protein [Bacteroidales bacterium]|nr:PepSY-associated TM helix domain-containing protein [Bacteroidales bacterium]